MYIIQQVTNDPLQKQNLVLPDGTQIQLTIRFVPMQYGWFMSMVFGTFELDGMRVCNSPNLLHQYRNQLPFGLACFSLNDREPTLQNDFSSGASTLYILSAAEVQAYAEFLSGG